MPRLYVRTVGNQPAYSQVCFTQLMATHRHPTIRPSNHQVLKFWRSAAEAAVFCFEQYLARLNTYWSLKTCLARLEHVGG